MSLLEKAKATERVRKSSNNINDEYLELAVAWLKDDISLSQISRVMDDKTISASRSLMTTWIKEAYRKGLIEIKEQS